MVGLDTEKQRQGVTVLVLDDDARRYYQLLAGLRLPGLETILATERAHPSPPGAEAADIILGRPDLVAAVLPACKRLRWVQSTYAGVDALMTSDLPSSFMLSGVKDIFGPLMSEYVFGYLLALERRIFEHRRNQQSRRWQQIPYRGLAGLTLGVAGLGSIGSHIARTGTHFGMRVLGMNTSGTAVTGVEQVFVPAAKASFLPQLDFLVLILPQTPDTTGFIGASELRLMKKQAILINVGRGCAVSLDELTDALRQQTIGGAVLDVFESEPLSADHPLWEMEQVIITPHRAAFSFPEQIVGLFAENYRRFISGQPLKHLIDVSRGY